MSFRELRESQMITEAKWLFVSVTLWGAMACRSSRSGDPCAGTTGWWPSAARVEVCAPPLLRLQEELALYSQNLAA
jgi:hypothetical protein